MSSSKKQQNMLTDCPNREKAHALLDEVLDAFEKLREVRGNDELSNTEWHSHRKRVTHALVKLFNEHLEPINECIAPLDVKSHVAKKTAKAYRGSIVFWWSLSNGTEAAVTRAAEITNVDRRTVYDWMKAIEPLHKDTLRACYGKVPELREAYDDLYSKEALLNNFEVFRRR